VSAHSHSFTYAVSYAFADACDVCGEADAELLRDYDVFHDDDSRPYDDHVDCSSDAVLRVHAGDA